MGGLWQQLATSKLMASMYPLQNLCDPYLVVAKLCWTCTTKLGCRRSGLWGALAARTWPYLSGSNCAVTPPLWFSRVLALCPSLSLSLYLCSFSFFHRSHYLPLFLCLYVCMFLHMSAVQSVHVLITYAETAV